MKGFTKGKGKGKKFIPTTSKKGTLCKKDLQKNQSKVVGNNNELMRKKQSLDRFDPIKREMMDDIRDNSISVKGFLPTDHRKGISMEEANANYEKNKEKYGHHNTTDVLNGMIVQLNEDYGKHKKGDRGQASSITTYGGKPLDLTVYWNDGDKYDTDIPTEDLDILDVIDTPSRDTRRTEDTTRGLDVVENGVRQTIPTAEPEVDPRDKDDNYDYEFMANTMDIVDDPQELASQITKGKEGSRLDTFVAEVEGDLIDKGFGRGRDAFWRTAFRDEDEELMPMEIGGLSSNELYAPNGGAEVQIYPDKIQVSGHYSEAEMSHARVFKLSETHEALKFFNKVMDDVNNVHHVSYW